MIWELFKHFCKYGNYQTNIIMDLLDGFKWTVIIVLIILYSMFLFQLLSQYLLQTMREKILLKPSQMNLSLTETELWKTVQIILKLFAHGKRRWSFKNGNGREVYLFVIFLLLFYVVIYFMLFIFLKYSSSILLILIMKNSACVEKQ